MKYLLEDADALELFNKNDKIALFLDFDGTLIPIAETPNQVFLPDSTKGLLRILSKLPQYQITIISGRSIEDIRRLVNVDGINYVGNHGYEIILPELVVDNLASKEYYILLEKIKKEISHKLFEFPGAFIEDKGVTISIHYRKVEDTQVVILEHALYSMTREYFDNKELNINMGKKVFEIRPPMNWDKGKALLWILEKQGGYPVYFGDDTTDEDAFQAIKNKGISVFVGDPSKAESAANYYLNNTSEVIKFLEYLKEVRDNGKL